MIKIALSYLKTNKLRTALSMFTVFVAVGMTTFFLSTQLFVDRLLSSDDLTSRQLDVLPSTSGLGRTLPYVLRKGLLAMPHVQKVVGALIVPGRTPEGFNYRVMACDIDELDLMQTAYPVDAESVDRWKNERTGVVIGTRMAEVLKLKPGMTMFMPNRQGELSFKVVGISPSTSLTARGVAHFDQVDETFGRPGQVHVFRVMVDDPKYVTATQALIEQTYRNSTEPVLTMPEQEFGAGASRKFGVGAIGRFLGLFAILLLCSTALVLGNNIAASTRERMSELAALRAIGFSQRRVTNLLILETLVPHALAGALAIALAMRVSKDGFHLNGFVTGLKVGPQACVVALLVAVLLPLIASLIPAIRASRQPVAEVLRAGA